MWFCSQVCPSLSICHLKIFFASLETRNFFLFSGVSILKPPLFSQKFAHNNSVTKIIFRHLLQSFRVDLLCISLCLTLIMRFLSSGPNYILDLHCMGKSFSFPNDHNSWSNLTRAQFSFASGVLSNHGSELCVFKWFILWILLSFAALKPHWWNI